jgi:hypothetical protein
MAWLRQRGHTDNSGPIDEPEKVLQFPDTPARSTEDRGKAALELVHRAADVIRGIEERPPRSKRALEALLMTPSKNCSLPTIASGRWKQSDERPRRAFKRQRKH